MSIMVLCALCGFPPEEPAGRKALAWKELFIQDAPIAWDKYAERARRWQGRVTNVTRNVLEAKILSEERYEFSQQDGSRLFLTQSFQQGGKPALIAEVSVVNPFYAFKLGRAAPDRSWAIQGLGRNLWQKASLDDPVERVDCILRTPYTFVAITEALNVTLLDAGFSINRVEPVEHADGPLYKVEFRYSPPKDAIRKTLRSGWALLDPKRYWVMVAFEARTLSGEVEIDYVASFQYSHNADGFPILKETKATRTIPSLKRQFESMSIYDLEEKSVSESDFRLTAFGFQEPAGVPRPGGSRWYLWFLALAILSLGAGWYIRRRARRLS